ncbi:hypothetical protein [Streptomyces sp. NPDC001222]|uniref:hypothetical protein n=1 Tax=Streptomyces sp. NPDC001222 TaxID=3364548 RepID=UPI0036A9D934
MNERRVVITGIGGITPGGIGIKGFRSPRGEGRTATRERSLFDASASRSPAAAQATADSGLEPYRTGVTAAGAVGAGAAYVRNALSGHSRAPLRHAEDHTEGRC